MGSVIIAWTIRVSIFLFFGSLIAWVLQIKPGRFDKTLRMLWSVSFMLFVAHVLAAFHFHHGWNHAAAVAETARQTRELIGLEFGAGLFFNYLFLLVWAFDVMWIWIAEAEIVKRYRWLRIAWLAYLIFIAFNGAAIFKSGGMRVGGIAALSLISLGVILRSKRQHPR